MISCKTCTPLRLPLQLYESPERLLYDDLSNRRRASDFTACPRINRKNSALGLILRAFGTVRTSTSFQRLDEHSFCL